MAFTTSGSGTISTLILIDLFRNTDRANWGQWWYEQYGPPSKSGLDKPGVGWDFLLYDDRIPAIDYRNVLPLHWFWPGAGVVFSRDSWSDIGTCVMFKSSRVVETHDDHDQNSIQIYKGGENPTATADDIIDSFLLGDVLSYGRGGGTTPNRWGSGEHCAYKMGSQSQASPGATGYWHSKFMEEFVPDTSSGDILRQIGPALYSYAQGDCSTAYVAGNNSETSYAFGKPRINDNFTSEFFHLRSLNLVFLYDRIKFSSAYSVGPATRYWHWPRTYPTLHSPNVYVLDAEAIAPLSSERNRIYNQIILPLVTPPWNFFDGALPGTTDTFDTGGAYVNVPLTAGGGQILYAFQPCTTVQTAMTTLVPIYSGTMQGVTVFRPTARHHIVFSAQIDAATPSSIYYDANKYDQADVHYVCNLAPNQGYLISETIDGGADGADRYTLVASSATNIFANSAGVLEFTPSMIAGQAVLSQTYTDSISMTDAVSTVLQRHWAGFDDSMSMRDSMILEPSGLLQLDFNDSISMSDSVNRQQFGNFYDAIGSLDSVIFEKLTTITIPETFYIEKMINTGSLDLRPRADVGASIFIAEPNDGISMWDKVADDDDATWISTSGPNSGSAQIEFLLSDPIQYLGAIELFQYVVRVRFADTDGSLAPYLLCAINGLGTSGLAATVTQPKLLFSTFGGAVDYVFDPIRYPIHRNKIGSMSMVTKIGGSVIGGKFNLQISRIGLRILQYSSSEKVI